jgi:hypothetical protein
MTELILNILDSLVDRILVLKKNKQKKTVSKRDVHKNITLAVNVVKTEPDLAPVRITSLNQKSTKPVKELEKSAKTGMNQLDQRTSNNLKPMGKKTIFFIDVSNNFSPKKKK